MPEYLAPGVYVKETSVSAMSIRGVATSTTGFVGAARSGPTCGLPLLVTSFEKYQRYFGDAADLMVAGTPTINHLAHAVQLFFENGGTQVYIARIFQAMGEPISSFTAASTPLVTSAGNAQMIARFPGLVGNLRVQVQAVRSGNLIVSEGGLPSLTGVRPGDVLEIAAVVKQRHVKASGAPASDPGDALTAVPAELAAVSFDDDGLPVLTASTGPISLSDIVSAQKITLTIIVEPNGDGSAGTRTEQIAGISAHPESKHFVGTMLRPAESTNGTTVPADSTQRVVLSLPTLPSTAQARVEFAGTLLRALVDNSPLTLAGGADGGIPTVVEYVGAGVGDSASGLTALAEVEDIAIVAAPGSAALGTASERRDVRDALITHCEQRKYRFAVLAAENNADISAIRAERSSHNSKYAALYHPWLVVPGSAATSPRDTLALSPEGAICGIYARSDTDRGVHKAPANENVRGMLRFSTAITNNMQDVLNPEGINCLRSFEGRGNRVWGARTLSSEPESKYINLRRLLIYLEHSIDRGTRWAVSEPNNEQLWKKIKQQVEAFLDKTWRNGTLTGNKPDEAFFVRCDRTTMSQNDLDRGRLACLVGVAPARPAEFVIFRIGQWPADANTN